MDYKSKLDLMQLRRKVNTIFGTLSGVLLGISLMIILYFFPATPTIGDRSTSMYLQCLAVMSEYKLFFNVVILLLVLSLLSVIIMILTNIVLVRRYNSRNNDDIKYI